jgi:hypothetical protein
MAWRCCAQCSCAARRYAYGSDVDVERMAKFSARESGKSVA